MTIAMRGGRYKVKLIKINEPFSPQVVLGCSYPQRQTERSAGLSDDALSTPRKDVAQTVDVPLPVRQQTALFYQVSPQVQRILTGMMPLQNTGNPNAFRQDVEIQIAKPASFPQEQLRAQTVQLRGCQSQNLRHKTVSKLTTNLHAARITD